MGVCLSCLGLRSDSSTSVERQRLLDDSAYLNYNATGYQPIVPPNALSPEQQQVEREALDSITRWANDQIVEIFPHSNKLGTSAMNGSGMNGTTSSGMTDGTNENGEGSAQPQTSEQQTHQDILLSMIPGDKSKRGIRIYPASRPGSRSASKEAPSIRSKGSNTKLNGQGSNTKLNGKGSGVFVKLDVDLP